jgi:type 1 glutamine amidotransferase
MRVLFLAVVVADITGSSLLGSEPEPAPKLKGLLITGGCCHDYQNQKQIITEGLSQRLSIAWDVVHEGGDARKHKVSVYKEKGWARKYDIIVHNECFGAVQDDKFVQSIAAAHHEGVPAIFIHCALHSYRRAPVGAEAWRELIGVSSQAHEGRRSVVVKPTVTDHPIMTGFPKEWKTPNGELYKILKIWPNAEPLAEAYGKDTKKNHPVIWTNKFGNARVFGTSLGHHNATMNSDIWLDVVSRGALWCVNQLDDDGNPKAGFEGTGRKPIVIKNEKPKPKADPKFQDGKKQAAEKAAPK